MASVKLDNVYLNSYFTVVGTNKYKSNILDRSDLCLEGYYFNKKTTEEGESHLLKESINGLKNKCKINPSLIIGSDLQNQLFSNHEANKNNDYSFLGVYSACASFIESIIIASSFVSNKMLDNIYAVSSSSNLVSEKQFRFPIEYGALRKCMQTFTLTAADSCLISSKESNIKVSGFTIGKVVDLGFKDVNNMGAVMAGSAAKTIYEHLTSFGLNASDYDLILTGDLGIYGVEILKKYIKKKYNIKLNNVMDAGSILIDVEKGKFPSGGSGPVCISLALFNEILKQKKYKKILLVGTGALFSKTTTNLKLSLPSISHAVSLEVK